MPRWQLGLVTRCGSGQETSAKRIGEGDFSPQRLLGQLRPLRMKNVVLQRVPGHVDTPLTCQDLTHGAYQKESTRRHQLDALRQCSPADLDDRVVQVGVLMPGSGSSHLPHPFPESFGGPWLLHVDAHACACPQPGRRNLTTAPPTDLRPSPSLRPLLGNVLIESEGIVDQHGPDAA